MKKYLIVAEVKPEHLEEYIDIHINVWPEMLEAVHDAGYTNEAIWIFKNYSIIYLECPDDKDHDDLNAALRATDVCKKWDLTVGPWFAGGFEQCPKVFDLTQQLAGELRKD
ncbi:MAG: L-rhamnose mutarotase [Clostridiales bacterium]|nr:L-rhamnose mutarotase [Clostridiales bacterium]